VCFGAQFAVVVLDAHQLVAVVGGHVLAFGGPGVEHLLTEVQGPVEGRAVVVHQLGVGNDGADAVNHALDLANVRLLGFDPQQVGAVLQAGDAVQNHAVFASARLEAEQAGGQTLGLEQLALGLDDHVAVFDVGGGVDVLTVQEAVVLVAQVARLIGDGEVLGQAGAQGVGTGNDHAVVNAQLQERVANRVDLGEEVGVRNGNLAVLVTALLFVGNLVLDLDAAGTGFDHLLGQQVGGFGVAETGVDVGDDRYNVGFEAVDLSLNFSFLGLVASLAGVVQGGEQQVQFAGVGLAQEGVQLFDQTGNGGLLVHGLVGQRTELGAQRGNHPAGQVKVLPVGGLQMLLDGDELLLTDEAVPATQGLGVQGAVGVVLGHVLAHDGGGVLGDVQAGLETVLNTHAGGVLGVDRAPGVAELLLQRGNGLDLVLICGHGQSFTNWVGLAPGVPATRARSCNGRLCIQGEDGRSGGSAG